MVRKYLDVKKHRNMQELKYLRRVDIITLRKHLFKWLKFIFSIIAITVSLYGLFCTVYSDVIVQNNNDFLTLPDKSLNEKKIEVTLDELVKGGENESLQYKKKTYIFILDINKANRNKQLSKNLEERLKKVISSLNSNSFHHYGFKIKEDEVQPNVMSFGKVRLYELLVELLKKNKGRELKDEFSIWVVGNISGQIFPDAGNKIAAAEKNIFDAIAIIKDFSDESDTDPNFDNLFSRLLDQYKDEFKEKLLSEYDEPSFIITILSDLLYDTDQMFTQRSEEVNRNWTQLEEKIRKVSSARIMANMLILAEKEPDAQKTIYPLFRRNIDWYRLNKYLMGNPENRNFLYTVRTTQRNIAFLYTNPYYVSKTPFIIRFTSDGENTIKLDMPSDTNSMLGPKISIFCEKLGGSYASLGESKRLVTGGSEFEVKLKKDQMIRLTYNGRLPLYFSSPILKLSIKNDCTTLLVPIDFVKRLPDWASRLFIHLRRIIILSVIIGVVVLILVLATFLMSKFGFKDLNPIVMSPEKLEEDSASPPEKLEKKPEKTKGHSKDSQRKIDRKIVNLFNELPVKELSELPGVGPGIAKKIKKEREKQLFKNIDDLKRVKGVNDNKIKTIKDHFENKSKKGKDEG